MKPWQEQKSFQGQRYLTSYNAKKQLVNYRIAMANECDFFPNLQNYK